MQPRADPVSMQPAPGCSERKALRESYRIALRQYIDAAEALDPLEPGEEFNRCYNLAMFAWLKFEEVRVNYQKHISEHRCT